MDLKEQMDPQTMLFIGDNYCKAYDLSYLNRNFSRLSKELQNAKEIYYKPRQSRNSWFNYKKALLSTENQKLSYSQRVILGSKANKLSDDLHEIPEAVFIDYLSYIFRIGPRDGLDVADIPFRLERFIDDYKLIVKYFPEKRCYGLLVMFSNVISGGLIAINGLFEEFEFLSDDTIVYYENENFKIPRNQLGEIVLEDIKIKVFKWDGASIDLESIVKPVRRDGEYFYFDEEIDDDYILIYNGVIYPYIINEYNAHYVQLTDTDFDDFSVFDPEKCRLYRAKDNTNNILHVARMYGFLNKVDNIIYFPATVENSMVLYNGCYHEYSILVEGKSIKLNIPTDIWVNSDYSFATATYFYDSGSDHICFCDHNSKYTMVVSDLLKKYRDYIDLLQSKVIDLERLNHVIYNDFEDLLLVDENDPTTFRLTYYPEEITIRLFINGVRYEKDVFFYYDFDNKNIVWKFTAANGGFDLDSSYEIIAIYDFNYEFNRTLRPMKYADFDQVVYEQLDFNNLKLSKIPNPSSSIMFVNGVQYYEGTDFTLDINTGNITWMRDTNKENGEAIDENDCIEMLYEFNYPTNGMDPKKNHEDKFRFGERIAYDPLKRFTIDPEHEMAPYFALRLIPCDNDSSIRLFINGVAQKFNEDYIYDQELNRIYYISDDFELEESDTIFISYNFLYSQNEIETYIRPSNTNYPTHVESLIYSVSMNNKFMLSMIPEDRSISFFINGVKYERDSKLYKFHIKTNTITWLGTDDFALQDGDEIAILYNYSYKRNHMIDPNEKRRELSLLDILGIENP